MSDQQRKLTKAEAGRLGGLRTLQRHGRDHFRQLGQRGAESLHSRYNLIPFGTSDFALTCRETGRIKALLSGEPPPAWSQAGQEES